MTSLAPITYRPQPGVRRAPLPATFWARLFIVLIVLCWGASFVIGFEAALAILTISGFVAAIVGLFRPVIGLLGIGMLCTLDPLTNSFLLTGGLLRWNTFNYWLAFVAVLFAPLLLGLNDVRNRLVQLFAVLLGLEVLVSPDWYRGLQDVLAVAAVFGLVVYSVRAGKDREVWLCLGLICGTTGAIGGIAFFAQQTRLQDINMNAWAYLPLTALFGICLAFPFAHRSRRAQMILAMLASANYALVFLSGSRGTLLTATGCAGFLFAVTRGLGRRSAGALSAALVALVLLTQFTDLQTNAAHRIRLLWDPLTSVADRTSGRSTLVVDGWNMFLAHPLGVGTGGFAATRGDLARPGHFPGARPAHAGWIKILAENGVPGFALMVAYVLSLAVAGWRSRNRDLFMLGLLAAMSFGLGFVSTEYQSKGLWFLAAGVMVLLRPGGRLTRSTPRSA